MPIPGEIGSSHFLPPIKNGSSGFMNLACFLIMIQWVFKGLAMQLLLYSRRIDINNKRLEAAVHKVIPKGRIELFRSLTKLGERLRTPMEPDSVAVLSASNREELQKMQLLRGLLTEIYVVLVIPDRAKSTIQLAHHLLPRFLSRKDGNFADLMIVLDRMYRNSQKSDDRELLGGVIT